MSLRTAAAVALMAIGLVAMLRATLLVARGQAGRSRLDLPLSFAGGFGLILVGQALIQ
jgi:hypothetical protein